MIPRARTPDRGLGHALLAGLCLVATAGCDATAVGMDGDAGSTTPPPDGWTTGGDSGIVPPDAAGPVLCGDGVCSPGENAVECPADCFRPEATAAVTTGYHHSCARTPAGTVRCWGYNRYGQLGDGAYDDTPLPQLVPGLYDVRAVEAGRLHTCALTGDGSLWCWGHNLHGQLGVATAYETSAAPLEVPGLTDAVALAAGGKHTCVVRADRTVWCWGANTFGQLGDGTVDARIQPGAVSDLPDVVALAAGHEHTCALQESGKVWCWGRNDDGQLGDGAWESAQLAGLVATIPEAVQLSAGARHTCVMLGDETAWCWGDNSARQLGLVAPDSYQLPTRMGTHWLGLSVAGGEDQTCLVRDDTTVWCWGALGVWGAESAEALPVEGLVHATAVRLGGDHGCAAIAGNGLWCWGRNDHGQLGDGTNESHAAPVRVLGL